MEEKHKVKILGKVNLGKMYEQSIHLKKKKHTVKLALGKVVHLYS